MDGEEIPMRIVLCAATLCALQLCARAQDFNLDLEPVGTTVGTAPASYGGPAQRPGVWNSITGSSAIGLLDIAGLPTGVSLSIPTFPPSLFWEQHDFSSAPDEALLDDYLRADWFDCDLEFTGLAPGRYAVYTVALNWQTVFPLQISVPGSPDPLLYVSGTWNGSYVLGSTTQGGAGNYSWQTKDVTSGTLQVHVYASGIADQIEIEGVQIVRLGPEIQPLCAGDGSLAPCPCANSGATGRGCENSASTGGGLLVSSGDTAPDTLVLHASGLLPSASAIFLQGTSNIAPLFFGDGLRCAGGVLKRLYLKSASGGAVSAPGPGDPSITQRSAALGDPIPPGDRRYYQVYYRDSNLGFCPSPPGASYNITNALRVFW
jgi:hypothetical protein